MADREKIIKTAERIMCSTVSRDMIDSFCEDVIKLLKEQQNLLGIQQTSDSITFISTGTAQQGEERGIMLGKAYMHEWLKKEMLYRGLLTDEIRSVFDKAKSI